MKNEIGSWFFGSATSGTPLLSLCNKWVNIMKVLPVLGCETEVIPLYWIHRFPFKCVANNENMLSISELLPSRSRANIWRWVVCDLQLFFFLKTPEIYVNHSHMKIVLRKVPFLAQAASQPTIVLVLAFLTHESLRAMLY